MCVYTIPATTSIGGERERVCVCVCVCMHHVLEHNPKKSKNRNLGNKFPDFYF